MDDELRAEVKQPESALEDVAPGPVQAGDEELLAELREMFDRVKGEIGRVIVGQENVVDTVLIAMMIGGHVLLEGVGARQDAARSHVEPGHEHVVLSHTVHSGSDAL